MIRSPAAVSSASLRRYVAMYVARRSRATSGPRAAAAVISTPAALALAGAATPKIEVTCAVARSATILSATRLTLRRPASPTIDPCERTSTMTAGLSVCPSRSSSCAEVTVLSAEGSTKSSALPADSRPVTGVPTTIATTRKTIAPSRKRRGWSVMRWASLPNMARRVAGAELRGGAASGGAGDARLRDAALELVEPERLRRAERAAAVQAAARPRASRPRRASRP